MKTDIIFLRRLLRPIGPGDVLCVKKAWLVPLQATGEDEGSEDGKAIEEDSGEGGRGILAGSKASLGSKLEVNDFLRRGPCRNAWALLRRDPNDGCDARRVRISGIDIDGDVDVVDEDSVFSSCMLV